MLDESGMSHIATVLIIIVIASFLAFTYFVGSDDNSNAVLPSLEKSATESTESLIKLINVKEDFE